MFLLAATLPFLNFDPTLVDTSPYRMGSQWSRPELTPSLVQNRGWAFERAALATGIINTAGGTAFYLGKFNSEHLIATNHHVCETGGQCGGLKVFFPMINRQYKMSMFVATMKDTDLTILKIDAPEADDALLAKIARNFSFKRHPIYQESLFTVGFGAADNDQRRMTGNFDTDCKVFSRTGNLLQIQDPDQMNPGPDRVWSFAHGCDISHGDSGSPILATSGEILGIIWTGAFPKKAATQDSNALHSILTHAGQDLGSETWTELNYAVPATQIPQSILDKIQTGILDPARVQILLRLIDQSR